MNRISLTKIRTKVDLLNHITNKPNSPYTWKNNKTITNTGNYHLSGAYGGWELDQICRSGGTRDVLNTGHIPKRELYNLICAYMEGIIRTKSNEI